MTALDTYACRVHVRPRIVACAVYFAMPPPLSSATLCLRKFHSVHSNIPKSSGSVCERAKMGCLVITTNVTCGEPWLDSPQNMQFAFGASMYDM
ncbi:hypothetical protein SCLCIDRAFT_1209946 [Scleroderma citrinum Foug A]|uniref:Uncharacterized protein n=1 Tax=Scleroderma citrinum Foug A TaxID=1036808 RepID=A0A0C3EHQ4_9AGAM|nr:hypothetical protein SCLCIDRAFT_1209946 [Scleroderma citrinum Foug A]